MLSLFKKILTVLNAVGILIKWWNSYSVKLQAKKEERTAQKLRDAEATIKDEKKLQDIRVKPASDADVIDELRNGDF